MGERHQLGALAAAAVGTAGAVVQGQWTIRTLLPPGQHVGQVWAIDAGHPLGHLDWHAEVWDGTQPASDLTPAGYSGALILGGKDGVQVGDVTFPYPQSYHAAVWNGSVESWVDLHPDSAYESHALAVDGGHQVGCFYRPSAHACLWSGTAASFVDLHPSGAMSSSAYGVEGGTQVGRVLDIDGIGRAAIWHGTAASVVYLGGTHTSAATAMAINGGSVVGYIGSNAYIWPDTGGLISLGTGAANAVYAGRQAGGVNSTTPCMWSGSAASRELLPLPPGSYTWINVTGIWSNGLTIYVVGFGQHSAGSFEPFLWTRPVETCYANCDGSTAAPVLNVNDFVCFLGKFANGDTYANCDGSTTPPVLNVNDFVCFATSFAQGCS